MGQPFLNMQPRPRESSIASTVAKCYNSFATVEDILDTGGDHPELRTALIDCLGQFRIWSGNTGAHQTGNSSLDHLLRDVPSVGKSVLQLLSSLDSLIVDVRLLLTNTRLSSDIFLHSTDSSSSESSEDEDEDEDAQGYGEAKQIFNDISELIAGLHRLSMSVRNPTVTRRYRKTMSFDTSSFEPYDIEHVRHKFPGASTNLTCRLGNANSRRRRWLKYRELHAEKLEQDPKDVYTSTRLSQTTVSSFKSESIFDSHAGTDTYESSTSMSATSDAMSENGCSKMRVPPMPNEAINEQPFECPYCHRIERVSHSLAWKKHVYSDLRPYLCTFEDCTSPNETYENRNAWFHHELQKHRRTWACGEHCEMTFGSEDLMVAHLHEHSPIALTDARARASARMRIIPINEIARTSCPICGLTIGALSKFRKHLGGHLEELALFVLPTTVADSDSEEDPISSCDEIGEDMEQMVLKEHEKDGDDDSAEMVASTEVAETSDYLKRSKHPSPTSSEELKLLKTDAKAYDRFDDEDENNDDQSSNDAASASSKKLEVLKGETEAYHSADSTAWTWLCLHCRRARMSSWEKSCWHCGFGIEENYALYDRFDEGDENYDDQSSNNAASASSEKLKVLKGEAEADHQVNTKDDQIREQPSENSPSATPKADHQVDEKDDKAEGQSTRPASASPVISNFAEPAFRSDNSEYRYGSSSGSGGGDFSGRSGRWFCCGCGDGPKFIKREVRCVNCHHNNCSNCGTE